MSINYHEMTMNEPRDSPARRKQFLVICTIGAALMANTAIQSGIFQPVNITEGIFPGGNFVYKQTARDYSAGMALVRVVADDLSLKKNEWADLLYTLHLDDANKLSTKPGKTRFAGGILVGNTGKEMKRELLGKNSNIKPWDEDLTDAFTIFQNHIMYEEKDLPSVDAAVAHFPFTNGFVSALIHSHKVFPALIKYGRENGDKKFDPVVITTCSAKESMCTHYVPLVQGKKFLLGQPTTEEYVKSLPVKTKLDPSAILKGLKRLFRWA